MGYRIPKGVTLVLAPYPLHLSAANYIQPSKFWPERWLPESSADDTVLDPGTNSDEPLCHHTGILSSASLSPHSAKVHLAS